MTPDERALIVEAEAILRNAMPSDNPEIFHAWSLLEPIIESNDNRWLA